MPAAATTTPSSSSYPGFPQATTMTQAFPPAVHDVFALDDLLTADEKALRYRVREFMVRRKEWIERERER